MDKINMAISGLSGVGLLLEPLLLKANYEGLGKEDVKELQDHIEMGVIALKKQIPKKINRKNLEESFKCPGCNSDKYWKEDSWCRECGQKLEWEV